MQWILQLRILLFPLSLRQGGCPLSLSHFEHPYGQIAFLLGQWSGTHKVIQPCHHLPVTRAQVSWWVVSALSEHRFHDVNISPVRVSAWLLPMLFVVVNTSHSGLAQLFLLAFPSYQHQCAATHLWMPAFLEQVDGRSVLWSVAFCRWEMTLTISIGRSALFTGCHPSTCHKTETPD